MAQVANSDTDRQWIQQGAEELRQLLKGEGRSDEPILQHWLEEHPAFVPFFDGPDRSGSPPWPGAVITQPRLTGIVGKVPDFCWIAADSAYLTAVLVEIEVPAKPWQHNHDVGQAAPLTHAREQIVSWRAWFRDPVNSVVFLNDYLVPRQYQDLEFRQHFVLVHGSREEYYGNRLRTRQRAAGSSAADETLMSFDRLPEIADVRAAGYGCVKREGPGFVAVSVPPTWHPDELPEEVLARTSEYDDAIIASEADESTKAHWLTVVRQRSHQHSRGFRYRPSH
jgi:hypothetical protein